MTQWQKVKIGEFLFEREGKYKPKDEALLGLSRIEKIDFNGNFHIGNKISNTNMILVKPGDLVISGINVAKGAMGIYSGAFDTTATIHYSSYTFDKNKINVEYFKRFLKSSKFIDLLKEQIKGGIKTEIKPKHILILEIQIPDITEQGKIVSHFISIESEDNDLKNEINQQQTLLKKLRQAILQEAIEGKLTKRWRKENPDVEPASILLEKIKAEKANLIKEKKIKKAKPLPPIEKDEIPFEIPGTWEWCRLGEITYGFQYGTSSKSSKNGLIPVLRMGNIQNGEIDWTNLVYSNSNEDCEKYQLNVGDILFNRTNSRELVGKTSLFRSERKAIFAGYLVRFHMAGQIYANFSNFIMNSEMHRDWCNDVKSDAIGQSNINATKLSQFEFPLPPLAEQKEIVNKVEHLFAICDELEVQINDSKANADILMQAVLKEAFSD